MVLERKSNGNFEKSRMDYDSSFVVKLLDRRNSEELMDMLGIKEALDRMAKASSMRWYGHVLKKVDESVMVKALKFKVSGSRGRGKPKQTWK